MDDKNDEYDKDGDADDINTNNNKVGNPRDIRPTYYSNTDSCDICNNYFVNITTEMLTEVHDTEVTDVGVIYFEKYRHMFHTVCVTICCDNLESIKCPCCDSVGLFLNFQTYNKQIDILNDVYAPYIQRDTIERNNVEGYSNVDVATIVVTAGGDGGDDNDDNDNDDDVADDKKNNDDGDNNDENNNDNNNYDSNPTYDNEDICLICYKFFFRQLLKHY